MTHDNTQPLDFLLSQYVDGTLDPAAHKNVELRLAGESQAQTFLKDHQDVQELLEDWGSRLPLIDWNAFDQTLAIKLGQEANIRERQLIWRRRLRPVAAAAALLMAALVGYAWHSESEIQSTPYKAVTIAASPALPVKSVTINDEPTPRAFLSEFSTHDGPAGLDLVHGKIAGASLTDVQVDGMPTANGPAEHPVLHMTDLGPLPGSAHAEATDVKLPNTQPAPEVLH